MLMAILGSNVSMVDPIAQDKHKTTAGIAPRRFLLYAFHLLFYSKLPYILMASSTVSSPVPTLKDATRI